MSNVFDYLDWRGDLTFKQSAFNAVDNLIFSEMAYVDFEDIIPGIYKDGSIALWEASRKFFKKNPMKELKKDIYLVRDSALLLKKMSGCNRYKNLRLSNYINKIEYEQEFQFSALVISLEEDTSFIAYRGTDTSIIGWKEDFNMSFMTPVPSQVKAVKYLEIIAEKEKGDILAGGHSKGGNLAAYAAIKSKPEIKKQIIKIYNNDGPGFPPEVTETDEYKETIEKIITYIPQNSVVGMLMEHKEDYIVVKSKKPGIVQHDMLNWEVMGDKLLEVDDLAKSSKILDATLKSWTGKLDLKQREEFINSLFSIIDETGAKTIEDLNRSRLKSAMSVFRTIAALEPDTRDMIATTLKLLFQSYNGKDKQE
ncbi:DUF2974 domain-containing protein [Parasporobacterium paucivorans]|uniref:DUF2974 domain-containing protein n=1 Tax=Parasporobacterium paucivorans DSM 15970 TaxID=1122934 RepID=A0A1M6A9Q5_9FIRM|nr:DUF2974 domain-containing protein [Parasporobacterium paucivorans]SHI33205.1 Protein of unknown function [Parasporobacterium paucivorans DSM 15970]